MKFLRGNLFYGVVLLTCLGVMAANESASVRKTGELPDIETVLMSPVEMEAVEVWAPVAKAGPFINRECDPQLDCIYRFALRPTVEHRKDANCFDGVARILGEYTAGTSGCGLPLTMFNGWQWECLYALGENVTAEYELGARGGCWEVSWEGQMEMTCSAARLKWVTISEDGVLVNPDSSEQRSDVEVTTFSAVRTRDGYPKTRQL